MHRKSARRRFGVFFITVGFLLIVSAGVFLIYNFWDNYRAESAVSHILAELDSLTGFDKEDGNKIGGSGGNDKTDDRSPTVYPDYVLNPNMEMPTVEIVGNRYIGRVKLPTLALDLPVIDSWDYVKMKIAPCRYAGSAYLGNLILCAHNYTSHFGRLSNLELGDEVIFTDIDGNVFHYRVDKVETLEPTAVAEMKSGDWDLTLFSCTPGGWARVTVRCTYKDGILPPKQP